MIIILIADEDQHDVDVAEVEVVLFFIAINEEGGVSEKGGCDISKSLCLKLLWRSVLFLPTPLCLGESWKGMTNMDLAIREPASKKMMVLPKYSSMCQTSRGRSLRNGNRQLGNDKRACDILCVSVFQRCQGTPAWCQTSWTASLCTIDGHMLSARTREAATVQSTPLISSMPSVL